MTLLVVSYIILSYDLANKKANQVMHEPCLLCQKVNMKNDFVQHRPDQRSPAHPGLSSHMKTIRLQKGSNRKRLISDDSFTLFRR